MLSNLIIHSVSYTTIYCTIILQILFYHSLVLVGVFSYSALRHVDVGPGTESLTV